MRKRRLIVILIVLAVLVAGVWLVVRYLPLWSTKVVGKTQSFGQLTPTQYAEVATVYTDQGINANSTDYKKAKEDFLASAKRTSSLADVHQALKALIYAAGGAHSAITFDPTLSATGHPKLQSATDSTSWAAYLPTLTTKNGYRWLKIPTDMTINLTQKSVLKSYLGQTEKLTEQFKTGDQIVIDLRNNSGGTPAVWIAALASMIQKGQLYRFVDAQGKTTHTVDLTKTTLAYDHGKVEQTPILRGTIHPKQLVILVDQQTASAAEQLAWVLKLHSRAKAVKIVGEPSAGLPTGNAAFKMPDQLTFSLTCANFAISAKKILREGDNLTPDTYTDNPATVLR